MSRPPVEYRQDAHATSLFVWTLLCAAVAAVLFVHSGKLWSRPLAAAEIVGGIALLIFGPLGLAVYLFRARRVWVSVDPERGIVVSGKRLIPWKQIERIERRRPRLRSKAGPAEMASLNDLSGDGSGCVEAAGCAGSSGPIALAVVLIAAALAIFWLIFVVFIPLVVIPVLEVYAPLGDRVKVIPREGRPLLLRDLRNAEGFLLELGERVRAVEV